MIEKFSDEELRQIMLELGMSSENLSKEGRVYKAHALCAERSSCLKEFGKKPISVHEYIAKATDFALNNFRRALTGSGYRVESSIPSTDIVEYKKMYGEIFEIIKKHNRPWKEGQDETL